MFCVSVVVSGWAVPDLIGCSAGTCCEQRFSQEKGTNNAVTGTVNLPLENWSHLPEVTLNYQSLVFANFKIFIKSLVVILDVSVSLLLL